jgi:ABC-type transport system substrate-binding protein
MKKNPLLRGAAALATSLALLAAPASAAEPKVLRYAFPIAETGFDPAQTSDLYSGTVNANIFEAPLAYDYLARPAAVKPQTAVALPEKSADFRTWTVRIRPGLYFSDDPAFKGAKRELVAQDYVYALKRHYDPRWKSPRHYLFEGAGILGLPELRKEALQNKPFDYDREVEGLRALDRYTLQVKFAEPQPRFDFLMADGAIAGAVAREVVEAYGDQIMGHPVGTGPYRLAEWRRSSKIVLERNPNYREHYYDERPPADDAQSVAIAKALKGKRLPLIDRVEVSIVEEAQPRWLSFLDESFDYVQVPIDFAHIAAPNGKLAPNLAKRGIQMDRVPAVDVSPTYFAMEHPVVGGYTPEKIALRRAISLAYDVQAEIERVRRGLAVPAQGVLPPQMSGHDPKLVTEMSRFDRARAKALLDLYQYTDKDGDGWRDLPDGKPLKLEYATQPDQQSRQLNELWKKSMDAIGVRIEFVAAKWPEQLKQSRAGKLMMWGYGWTAASPDGTYFVDLGYGPTKGAANHARFDLPAYNELQRKQVVMPDGPERDAVLKQQNLLLTAYMPYKFTVHRIHLDLTQPWLVGYRKHPFLRDFWRYVDIDGSRRDGPQ